MLKKGSSDIYVLPPNFVGVVMYQAKFGGVLGKAIGDVFSFGISAAKEMAHVHGYISASCANSYNTLL